MRRRWQTSCLSDTRPSLSPSRVARFNGTFLAKSTMDNFSICDSSFLADNNKREHKRLIIGTEPVVHVQGTRISRADFVGAVGHQSHRRVALLALYASPD